MNDISASIGLANLDQAHYSVNMSRLNSLSLIEGVKNDKLVLPKWDETCSYWLFSMHVKNCKAAFMEYLTDNKIANSPVHYRNDLYDSTVKYKEGPLFGVTEFDRTQICIPNGWWLTEDDLRHMITVLNKY
jgi:dTDP-4-amino-4,6-dideoxygalactose transaminase